MRKRIKLERGYDVGGVFKGHRDIIDMRAKFTDATGTRFSALFQKGVLNYEAGEWLVARDALEECLQLVQGDGPSQALVKFMANTQFVKPANWLGYRNIGCSLFRYVFVYMSCSSLGEYVIQNKL